MLRTYFRRDLVIFRNFDLFRSSDLFSFLILLQTILGSLVISHYSPPHYATIFFVLQALFWRLFHTYALGFVLYLQSTNGFWNRYWIKHGEGVAEGFKNWKSIFNMGMVMTYTSFWACVWQCYQMPWGIAEWTTGSVLLRHTIGIVSLFSSFFSCTCF